MAAGIFEGGTGFEQQFMEKCHVIRAQYGAIGDELQGRMPLAYAHIVQVLLDVVLWMYPFMALSTGMAWHTGIVGTGLLTIFYQGLFDLAKQFLDPYDNENYGKGDDPLMIDTLIAETNAGSVRWMNSFQEQPWNRQLLNDGEMYDSILPLRGYSVEELMEKEAQEEQEQLERERIAEEKKKKKEESDRKKAEELLMKHVDYNRTSMIEKWNGTAVLTTAGEVMMKNSDVDGGTFMEVSGGQVVTMSSLLPSSSMNNMMQDVESLDSITATATEETEGMESNRVLTLGDGTLVTLDETLTLNTTESNNTATVGETLTSIDEATEENVTTSDATPAAVEELAISPDTPPPLLADTNEVAWDQLGATPNFAESIAEMEIYKASRTPTVVSKKGINNGLRFDENLEDDDLENEDIFEPMNIEWFDEVGPDGQEYRK